MDESLQLLIFVSICTFIHTLFCVFQITGDDYTRLFLKPYEVWYPYWTLGRVADKRSPRSSEIKVIKAQLKLLRGNTAPEAIAERDQLKRDLKALRDGLVEADKAARLVDDLAMYTSLLPDIKAERALRNARTALISSCDLAELEARREAFENTE